MKVEDIGYVLLGGIIVLFFTYTAWHPSQNDYVEREDYNKLYQDYQEELQKNTELEKSMANLILEFYTKEFVFGTAGFKKHKLIFCTLDKHLTGEIPLLSKLICNN